MLCIQLLAVLYMCACCVQVTLEDMYNGKLSKLAVQRNMICDECNGKGGKEVCNITIHIHVYIHVVFHLCIHVCDEVYVSIVQGAVQVCTACNGQGVVVISNAHFAFFSVCTFT